MLTLFRINDPYRLIFIFFLLLAVRLPLLFGDAPLTGSELRYMLVGEKMAEGASLYDGILENIAPLSAGVYMVIDFLFGRSQAAYYWISLFVVFFQCFLLNKLLIESKAYNENTYLPGLIYAVLLSTFFDFLILTPVLMSLTFILLALNNIFRHVEFRAKRDEKILNIGLYLGLASLFYLPSVIFGIAAIFIFMFFTGTITRRYVLMIYGFLMPLLLTALYFLLTGRIGDFIYSFINPLVDLNNEHYMGIRDLLMLFALPLAFLLLSFVRINQGTRFTNYQSRLLRVMGVWIFFCIIFVLLCEQRSPSVFVVFAPPFAFFITHYLLLIRKRFLAEIAFSIFIIGIIGFNFALLYHTFGLEGYINTDAYLINQTPGTFDKQRILVLGEDISPYKNARAASPFLNWKISKPIFKDLEYYDNLALIYNGLINDPPEVIIDPNGIFPNIREKIPALKKAYSKKDGYYHLN